MQLRSQYFGKTKRKSFSKIEDVLEMPNLIEVQKKSFKWFLDVGMDEVLRDASPVKDFMGKTQVDFVRYSIDPTPATR